jgi:hypothetical protein
MDDGTSRVRVQSGGPGTTDAEGSCYPSGEVAVALTGLRDAVSDVTVKMVEHSARAAQRRRDERAEAVTT